MIRSLAVGLCACLAVSASASANRAAHAPLRAPNVSDSRHVSFSLAGNGWAQVVGALAGTPALGNYALETPVNAGQCRITASVNAVATRTAPRVRESSVQLRPGARLNRTIRYKHRGQRGPVRWWSGTSAGVDAAAGGVQRAPQSLAGSGRKWIVYEATLTHRATGTSRTAECNAYAKANASRTALLIARTMRLATGPPRAEAPFITA